MTEGERWTQALLERLAAGRFRPRAWWRFLAESFVRASEDRAGRPAEAATTWLLATVGLAAWGVAIPTIGLTSAGVGAGWWLLVSAMVRWHLGMLESPAGVPIRGIGVANVISLTRLGAAPLFVVLPARAAAVALVVAAASDVADGRIARTRGTVTRFGHWVDGSADTLMVAAATVGLVIAGTLATWAGLLVAARAAVPWIGLTAVYFVLRRTPPRDALMSGRIPGALLIAGLVATGLDVPGGETAVAIGAAGGLVTWIASSVRGARMLRTVPSPATVGGAPGSADATRSAGAGRA